MDFLVHFGNCHGEMTVITSILAAMAGAPVIGVLFARFRKPKHDCCDHIPKE